MKKQLFTILSACLLFIVSCGEDKIDDILSGTIPDDLKGQVVNMEFSTSDYGPYKMGDIVEFTFSSSGSLFIKDAIGNTLTLETMVVEGNEFIWEDNDHSKRYAVSLTSEGKLNEINLLEQTDNSFLGQFVPAGESSGDALDIIKGLATKGKNDTGHYDVVAVNKGTHERMTILIDPEGNINFDETVSFSVDNYELVTDATDCCKGVWIDMSPYPTETYPRLEVYLDENGELSEMHYSPEYPNVSGKVEVTF